MANPDFVDFSNEQDSAGSITVNGLAGGNPAANQILILYVATDGFTPTLQTANGYQIATDPGGNVASVNIPGVTGMHVFWKRAVGGGGDTPPVLTSATSLGGTVQACHQVSYNNCRTSGTPFHLIKTGTLDVASTTANPPFIVTRLSGCTLFGLASTETDDSTFNSWGQVSPGVALSSPGGTIDSGWHSSIGNDASWAGGRGGMTSPATGAIGSTFGATTRQAQITFALASLNENFTAVQPPPVASTASAVTPTFTVGAVNVNPPPVASTASAVTPSFDQVGGFNAPPVSSTASAVTPTFTVGGVNVNSPPVASTASAVTPLFLSSQLEIGAHGSGVILFAAAGNDPAVFTINSQPSGSMFIAFVGGNMNNLTQATAPTDNKGNTWRPLVPQDGANNTGAGAPGAREYNDFPGYGTVVYSTVANASGGVGHQITKVRALEDEVSIDVIEVKNAKTIRSIRWSHPVKGQTIRSQPVTSSNPCIVLGSWWGDAPVNEAPGGKHTVTVNNGYTVLGGFGIDYPQGYVQNYYIGQSFATGTNGGTNVTYVSNDPQGAQLWMVDVEGDWNDAAPAVATATGVTPSFSGQQQANPPPVASTASAVTPSLTAGAVSSNPPPVASTGTAVTPTLTAGTVNSNPPPVASTASAITPALTPAAFQLTFAPVASTGSAITPTLSLAPFLLALPPVASTGSAVGPTLTAGAASFTPPPVASTASAVTPFLTILGEPQSFTPPPVASTASAVTPVLLQAMSVVPAVASGSGVTPTLTAGLAQFTASPASAIAIAVANSWIGGTPVTEPTIPTRVFPLTPQYELPRGPGVPAGGGGRRNPFRIS